MGNGVSVGVWVGKRVAVGLEVALDVAVEERDGVAMFTITGLALGEGFPAVAVGDTGLDSRRPHAERNRQSSPREKSVFLWITIGWMDYNGIFEKGHYK